jgi:ribose transport system substrate-binding protein
MRAIVKIWLCTVAAGGLVLGGVGGTLAADQQSLIAPIAKPITLMFIPKLVHPWYQEVQNGADFAVAELKKQGIAVTIKWNAQPTADVVEQNQRIETGIGIKPDGLAVSCLDPATNNTLLQTAVEAGIPLVTFDTYCSDAFPFIGHEGDLDDGYRIGQLIAEKLGGKGEVGILSASPTASNHATRVIGFKKAIAEHPGMKIAFEQPDNDDLEQAFQIAENQLQAHPDVGAIFAASGSDPIGAARAATNAGKAGKIIIMGFEVFPETITMLKSGAITATIVQRQWEQGYWAVQYLVAAVEKHTIPHFHETGARFLTKDNL